MNVNVSVIVPVYKVEQYLSRCINSLLKQNFDSYEIILVDDGSPDNCPVLCDEFEQNNSCIRTFHKSNGGLGDARNFGVKQAKAEYIAFVDSDDYVEENYISDLWKLKEEYDADLVITKVVREPENSTVIKRNDKFLSYCTSKESAIFEVYGCGKVGWQAYGKLYRRDTLLKYPFPNGYYEDCAVMYKIIDSVDKIAIGDFEGNYHYIQRDGSILNSKLNDKHFRIFDICKEFEQFCDCNHSKDKTLVISMYKRALVQLLNLQTMSWSNYKELFNEYRPLFRENIIHIFKDKRLGTKEKLYYMLLASWPSLFKLQNNIILLIRKQS